MAPTLSSLPDETAGIISNNLRRQDISNIRLVSKEMYRKSLHRFQQACFGTFYTDFSTDSLTELEALSNQEHLKCHLQKLVIRQSRDDVCKDGSRDVSLGRGIKWNRHSEGYITADAPGYQRLLRILAEKLVNCRSICIEATNWSRAATRGEHPGTDIVNASDAINLVFTMLTGGTLRLKHFQLCTWKMDFDICRLNIKHFQCPHFLSSWAKLSSLSIKLSFQRPDQDGFQAQWVSSLVKHAKPSKTHHNWI